LYRIWAPSWGNPTVDCKPHADQRVPGHMEASDVNCVEPASLWHEVTNVRETTARFLVSLYCALSKPSQAKPSQAKPSQAKPPSMSDCRPIERISETRCATKTAIAAIRLARPQYRR
jgi:hypothetical protein